MPLLWTHSTTYLDHAPMTRDEQDRRNRKIVRVAWIVALASAGLLLCLCGVMR